jgi:hypothetical protein
VVQNHENGCAIPEVYARLRRGKFPDLVEDGGNVLLGIDGR